MYIDKIERDEIVSLTGFTNFKMVCFCLKNLMGHTDYKSMKYLHLLESKEENGKITSLYVFESAIEINDKDKYFFSKMYTITNNDKQNDTFFVDIPLNPYFIISYEVYFLYNTNFNCMLLMLLHKILYIVEHVSINRKLIKEMLTVKDKQSNKPNTPKLLVEESDSKNRTINKLWSFVLARRRFSSPERDTIKNEILSKLFKEAQNEVSSIDVLPKNIHETILPFKKQFVHKTSDLDMAMAILVDIFTSSFDNNVLVKKHMQINKDTNQTEDILNDTNIRLSIYEQVYTEIESIAKDISTRFEIDLQTTLSMKKEATLSGGSIIKALEITIKEKISHLFKFYKDKSYEILIASYGNKKILSGKLLSDKIYIKFDDLLYDTVKRIQVTVKNINGVEIYSEEIKGWEELIK